MVHSDQEIKNRETITGSATLNKETKSFIFVESEKRSTKKNPLVYKGHVMKTRKNSDGYRITVMLGRHWCEDEQMLAEFGSTLHEDLECAFGIISDIHRKKR